MNYCFNCGKTIKNKETNRNNGRQGIKRYTV